MHARVVGLAVGLLLLGALAVAFARPETFWSLDGKDLADSVGGKTHGGFAMVGPCVSRLDGIWKCRIDHDPGSGARGVSRVTVDEDRCWVARTEDESTLEGCVGVFDYLPL